MLSVWFILFSFDYFSLIVANISVFRLLVSFKVTAYVS